MTSGEWQVKSAEESCSCSDAPVWSYSGLTPHLETKEEGESARARGCPTRVSRLLRVAVSKGMRVCFKLHHVRTKT